MKYLNHIILSLLVISFLGACKDEKEKKKEVIRPVKYEIVNKINAQKTRTFSGVAIASDEIELSFRSNGIITKLNAKTGKKVKKGDLLIKLDNVQAQLSYEQSISALYSAKSAMNTAKSSLERSRALYENGSHSLSDYEAAKNSFQSALDRFESAKRKKEIDELNISYGYIYAPKSGIIAAVNISLNETVSSGQIVAILNAGKEVSLIVGLPESVINKVIIGMKSEINFTSMEGQEFSGDIIEIAPIVDSKSSTFPVKINISNPVSTIKPGMVANATFTFGSDKDFDSDLLIVPVKSVGEDGDGTYVFVIESEDGKVGIVKKQKITLGELTNEGFIIKSGLVEGQKIATAGLQTLLNGQKVKLQ